MLGTYFDSFLKANYFKESKNKIVHATERVIVDFKHAERELREGIGFIEEDDTFIASMELINNYQDKDNYNAALLDEEKKEINKYLLQKIKASFNASIKLYDKNEELIAFVYKDKNSYRENFISYENAKKVLYSKYETDLEYKKSRFQDTKEFPFVHVDYYTQPELKRDVVITHHHKDAKLYIMAHNSIFDKEHPEETKIHIEMGKAFDGAYFQRVSSDLDLDVSVSKEKKYEKNSLALFAGILLDDENILEYKDKYLSAFSIMTKNNYNIYLLFSLDKGILNESLNKNRQQLILFLIVSIVVIIILSYFLIHQRISTPLAKLMEQINKIKTGDYSSSEIVKTTDELEVISKNINMLATSLKHREISLKESQKQLEHLSTHDELTGLLNRRSFSIKLEYALQKAQRNKTKIAVLFLDLDDFKQVNDTLGHSTGDNLLKAVANRLEMSLRESDALARVGGDEFNIFVEGFKNITELQFFAQKILDEFIEPYVDMDYEIVSSTSIGISIFPDDGKDVETLIKNADLAMYKSKDSGRNNYSFYSTKFSENLQYRMDIVQSLKAAIKNQDEFVLNYQPKISVKTQKIVGVEALIRWNSPELGFVRPDEFIKIAEETHMIIDIGTWVMRQACTDFMKLKNSGYALNQISVNVSGVQLEYSNMLETVKDVILQTNIQASELELEVTESYIATNEDSAIDTLSSFRDMGIELAIDDFGTGYSSMSYLQALPITRLKIDKAFVDELPHSKESVAVVQTIIALAQAFNLKITVEGVELKEQFDFFQDKYCDEIQGYYYSKPLSFSDLKKFIEDNK